MVCNTDSIEERIGLQNFLAGKRPDLTALLLTAPTELYVLKCSLFCFLTI